MAAKHDCMSGQNDTEKNTDKRVALPVQSETAVPNNHPTQAAPLTQLDQLVTAERLREIVWEEGSRPSLQWIRKETKRRMLPHIRRGRLIFYKPRSVLEWYAQRESRPASMK